MANADLCVHAGDQDTCGLGALEAMASGVLELLSAADGLGELAETGGLAVAGHRVRDWADALAFALATDLASLRAQALAHARAHGWPLVLAQMVQRYQWLLQQDALQRQATHAVLPTQPGTLAATAPITQEAPEAPADLLPSGLPSRR